MDDERAVVAERGLLTVPDEVWNLAVRRAEVIKRLDGLREVGRGAADEEAAELVANSRSRPGPVLEG